MLELATWAGESLRSFLIVTVKRGGNVYLDFRSIYHNQASLVEITYQAQNASIKPIQEKKKTRP